MARAKPTAPPPAAADPRGLAALMERYLEWLGVRNYSPRSLETYRLYLGQLRAWCEERGLGRPEELTREVLERYQHALARRRRPDGRPLSAAGQMTRLVTVRTFCRYLVRQQVLPHNPASELELPRLEQRLPRHVLTAAEAESVLAAPDVASPLGLRDRAILETLYSTGMRRLELIGLKLLDLDGKRGTVIIRQGKGKKDRMIPIGERAVAWVERYLEAVRPSLVVPPDDGTIFLMNRGVPLSTHQLSALVRDYVDRAGIGKRGSCHLFRHTAATLMLEGGADVRFVQELLGHAKLSTTDRYTRVAIRKLKEVHTATHPGACLRRRGEGPARLPGEDLGSA